MSLGPTLQISARNFSWFRFLFGMLMIPQVFELVPSIHELSKSTIVFHYPYLTFIEAYSHELINFLTYTSIFSAFLLALGVFPRISALVFLISFGYLFLIDMTFYNNHYYLWCLLAFLFVITETNKSISVVDLIRGNTKKNISIMNYYVFAMLISIVYFFGGLAKINGDWLQGYPMRMFATAKHFPMPDTFGFVLSYGGLVFDLFIWILLWKKPKSLYVIIPYFLFHLSNYFMFNIGEFPFVMMAGLLIFTGASKGSVKDFVRQLFAKLNLSVQYVIYILFFVVQLLFPMRYLLAGGNVAWHRQGYFFSWRMMLNNHEPVNFQFYVTMPDKKVEYAVNFEKLLTFRQFSNTYHDPYMIWLIAQKLKKDAQKKYQSNNVIVNCESIITLNQHEPKPLINTKVNLAEIPYHFLSNNHFINQF